jgi:hypothetical protein
MIKRLVLVLASLTAAYAQSDTASLSGAITDSGSAVIPGAKVSLRNVATRSQRTVLSDIQGLYRFSLLIPGTYEITIDSQGMKQFHDAELVLNVAQAARLDGNARSSVESNDSRVTPLYDAFRRLTTAALDGLRVFNSSMRIGISL